jgi:hypothetical protein
MYYTGIDPRDMKPVYVARDPHEKALQRALLQYRMPENWHLVREALQKAGREDLIGFEERCLIRPYPPRQKDKDAPVKRGRTFGSGQKAGEKPASDRKSASKSKGKPNKPNNKPNNRKTAKSVPAGKHRRG